MVKSELRRISLPVEAFENGNRNERVTDDLSDELFKSRHKLAGCFVQSSEMSTLTIETTKSQPRLNYAVAAPATLQAMLAISDVTKKSGLEISLHNLVTLRASQINGCAFCIDMHVRDAKAEGETDERLYLLDAWREVDVYTQRERAALHWTEVLTRLSDGHVTDEDFALAREEFSESELANLTLAIVVINGWNRFNVGFRIPARFEG
jgi:AhpD family alkylhydroperoxidase